ncbi:FAD-binding oxidoreductase [Methylobacterium oryzae CBMB20]
MRFARTQGFKVVVRGGHNRCQPTLRNGGIPIDLGRLDKIRAIDAEQRRAVIQPILSKREIQKALNAHGRAFPTGQGCMASGGDHRPEAVQGRLGHRRDRGGRAARLGRPDFHAREVAEAVRAARQTRSGPRVLRLFQRSSLSRGAVTSVYRSRPEARRGRSESR